MYLTTGGPTADLSPALKHGFLCISGVGPAFHQNKNALGGKKEVKKEKEKEKWNESTLKKKE